MPIGINQISDTIVIWRLLELAYRAKLTFSESTIYPKYDVFDKLAECPLFLNETIEECVVPPMDLESDDVNETVVKFCHCTTNLAAIAGLYIIARNCFITKYDSILFGIALVLWFIIGFIGHE